jgi:hypothetical protein
VRHLSLATTPYQDPVDIGVAVLAGLVVQFVSWCFFLLIAVLDYDIVRGSLFFLLHRGSIRILFSTGRLRDPLWALVDLLAFGVTLVVPLAAVIRRRVIAL